MKHCRYRPGIRPQKAVVATGHHLLVIAYHILAAENTYQELGPDDFNRLHRDRAIRRRIKQLEQLGYKVTLEQPAAQPSGF
jgi:transposase